MVNILLLILFANRLVILKFMMLKKSSEDSQFYRFCPFDHWSDLDSNCSSFCSFQVYMKDDLISCWLWTYVQCYYSTIYCTVVHWWFFFLVAVVVVFVVVVNNNEKISYQGHYQIHVLSRLCYIFFSSCCLVLFFAPSFSLQLFQWDTVFWKIISSITC